MVSSGPDPYSHELDDGRLQCDLCPRHCHLREGQRGLCFIRRRQGNCIVLSSYGRSSGFCIDPIEKKPLHHFLPGSAVLSFGTAGCNLACKFCQNWDISTSRRQDTLASSATPQQLAQTAAHAGCRSIAYTYNDPVIFLEYAVDTALAAKTLGVASVAVSAGYVQGQARRDFFAPMDAANIDLKAFSTRFYKKLCGGALEPVLETLEYLVRETTLWLEITTLLIPGENDSEAEIEQMTAWISSHLGPDVPLHFSAFHPDWKMTDTPPTSAATLLRSRRIAMANGLNYVYTGNIHDMQGGSTWCPNCHQLLIERDWYALGRWNLKGNRCTRCAEKIAGHFEDQPGRWGRRRLPLSMV